MVSSVSSFRKDSFIDPYSNRTLFACAAGESSRLCDQLKHFSIQDEDKGVT